MTPDRDAITELTLHECLELLRSAEVGRLAVSQPAHPHVFPVNYVVDHGTVVFRTAAGTKLDAIALDHDVTFEADGYDAASGDAWSVIVKGRAAEVPTASELVAAAELPLFPWQAGAKPRVVRIEPLETTGRRFRASRPTAEERAAPPPQRAASE
jgi:nitroimidazol reductase NimA-like FMN-containing flavoprotein (pyridoxamine 5'-phosphate oxidase superfamily)